MDIHNKDRQYCHDVLGITAIKQENNRKHRTMAIRKGRETRLLRTNWLMSSLCGDGVFVRVQRDHETAHVGIM